MYASPHILGFYVHIFVCACMLGSWAKFICMHKYKLYMCMRMCSEVPYKMGEDTSPTLTHPGPFASFLTEWTNLHSFCPATAGLSNWALFRNVLVSLWAFLQLSIIPAGSDKNRSAPFITQISSSRFMVAIRFRMEWLFEVTGFSRCNLKWSKGLVGTALTNTVKK